MKKSKVDKIKKCLRKGVPVAGIVAGIITAFCGCDSSSNSTGKLQGKPVKTDENYQYDKEIKLNDEDFSEDLSRLSTVGEKKLENFINEFPETRCRVKIVIADTDAKRKRQKAKAVFDKFSFVYLATSGITITPRRRAQEQIVEALTEEFNFLKKGRW